MRHYRTKLVVVIKWLRIQVGVVVLGINSIQKVTLNFFSPLPYYPFSSYQILASHFCSNWLS